MTVSPSDKRKPIQYFALGASVSACLFASYKIPAFLSNHKKHTEHFRIWREDQPEH
jgi:hypothetical protein